MPRILAAQNRRLGRQLGDDELSDLSQNALIAILRKLESFEGRAALETWVFRFCYLELMNGLRRHARRPRAMSELEDDENGLEPWQELPSREPEPGEQRDESIEKLLCHLSGREAAVVRLRHLEQVETLAEIAEMLGISLSSVKTHYYRGLEKLRVILDVGKAAGREDVKR